MQYSIIEEPDKMTRKDMLIYLKIFSERIHKLFPNEQFNIVLVGAASLVIPEIIERSSEDIDYTDYFRNKEINDKLNKIAIDIANQLDIGKKWLNSDFVKSPSGYAVRFSEKNTYLLAKGHNLNIYSITPIATYCMKIMANREKDLNDINELEKYLSEHNVTCMNVVEVFESLYSQQFDQYLTDEQFALVVHNRILKTGVRGDWSEYRQENFNVIDLSTLDQEPEKATTYTRAKKIKAF